MVIRWESLDVELQQRAEPTAEATARGHTALQQVEAGIANLGKSSDLSSS
ncbi:unnamed protein product [Ectocarpus sp. CCAP 1310/34]|nr:unnamed protein product [Ectocarpus sp. CCAP 1310/34]